MNYRTIWHKVGPFSTGILIGALAWTPAFAATLRLPQNWQPYLLIGSLVLLVIALGLKAIGSTRRPRFERIDDSVNRPSDLRDTQRIDAIDVPLHQ